MKSVNKSYITGFILIILIGAGLLIGGAVHYLTKWDDMIETQGYVVSVYTRMSEDGVEFRPSALRYFVDGEAYETPVFSWFNYPIQSGDTMTVWYKKSNPRETTISNVSKDTFSFALMGCGGILIAAGVALTVKYLFDVKRRKKGMKSIPQA